jgi:hypothetical protein
LLIRGGTPWIPIPIKPRSLLDIVLAGNNRQAGVGDAPDIPLSRATGGVRALAEFLATFFSGALAFGVTRSIDHPDKWKFTGRIGQGF